MFFPDLAMIEEINILTKRISFINNPVLFSPSCQLGVLSRSLFLAIAFNWCQKNWNWKNAYKNNKKHPR